jgi:hypothetical protein
MIPAFTFEGCLPEGIYEADWDEIQKKFGYTNHRKRLLSGSRHALSDLALAGCKAAYLDGSFITTKETPGDFDACWDDDGVDWDTLDETLLSFENTKGCSEIKIWWRIISNALASRPLGKQLFRFLSAR